MKTALKESAEFIFNECQIRLKQLSELNSPQDLVEKINELKELPKFAETLRILLSFGDLPMEEPPMYPIENQLINSKKSLRRKISILNDYRKMSNLSRMQKYRKTQ